MKGLYIFLIISLFYLFCGVMNAQPPCNPDSPEPERVCQDFDPPLCNLGDIHGYCGRNPPCAIPSCPPGSIGWCNGGFSIENAGFFRFLATGSIVELILTFSNCATGSGVQLGAYDDCNGVFLNPITCDANCFGGNGQTGQQRIRFNGIAGRVYSIMVDGCGGDQCDYVVSVIKGAGVPEVGDFDLATEVINGLGIQGDTLCFAATDDDCLTYSVGPRTLARGYLWYVDGNLVGETEDPEFVLTGASPPGVQLCVEAWNACDTSNLLCSDIVIAPLPPVEKDTCICWNDFPVEMFGINFDFPVTDFPIPMDGECGCEFTTLLTIEAPDIPAPELVINAICPSDLEPNGYRYPGQSEADSSFYGDTTRIITIPDGADPFLCLQTTGEQLICDKLVELQLIVLEVKGKDTTIVIPCGVESIELDTTRFTFLPEDDEGLKMDFTWYRDSLRDTLLGPDTFPTLTVMDSGYYSLVVRLWHDPDDLDSTVCSFQFNWKIEGIFAPDVTATPSDTICGTLRQDILGGPNQTPGFWEQVSGPGTSTFAENDSASTTVTVSIGGVYVFRWIENYLICPDTAEITLYFNNSDPGSLPTDLLEACEGDPIQVNYATPPILDFEDSFVYVLHNGPGPGIGNIIYGKSHTGIFPYQVGYPLNVRLFVSIAAGNWVADSVDLQDPCLVVSNLQPLVWYQNPYAQAGPDGQICARTFMLSATASIGAGAWNIVYGPGNANFTVPNQAMTEVTVDQSGVYGFEWLENNSICEDRDTVMIRFDNTDAGEPRIVDDTLCIDESFVVEFLPGQQADLDPEDVLEYGLYTLSDVLIKRFSDATIRFDPNVMQPNVTYEIRTIAGNEVGGQVDLNDPCFDRSTNALRLTWEEYPMLVSLSSLDDLCAGDIATILISISGNAPFIVQLTDGTNFYDFNNVQNVDSFKFQLFGPTTFTVVSIQGQYGGMCLTSVNQDIMIDVEIPPEVTVQKLLDICNKDLPGRTTFIDFNNWVLDGDTGGFWTDLDNSGGAGTLPVLDFTGVTPGTYRFKYTTQLNLLACMQAMDTMYLTVTDTCPCPIIPLRLLRDLCNTEAPFNLLDLEQNLPVDLSDGDWSVVQTPSGNNPVTITNDRLNVLQADTGLYVIEFKLNNFTPLCPDSAQLSFRVFGPPNPGNQTEVFTFCQGDDLTIMLHDQLEGEDLGGIWRIKEAADLTGIDFDGQSGTLRTSNMVIGTYIFEYSVGPNGACPVESSEVRLEVNPNPIADPGQTIEFNCNIQSGTLGGANTTVGPNIAYIWSVNGIDIPGATDRFLDIDSVGNYTLTVVNTLTGCTDAASVVVTADPTALTGVELDVRDETCPGENDGILAILRVNGGVPPFKFSIDGLGEISTTVLTNLQPDTYTLTITDSQGCTFTTDFTINPSNEIVIEPIGDQTVLEGDSVDVTAIINRTSDQISRIEWLQVNTTCDTCTTINIKPDQTRGYAVRVIDINGCEAIISFKLIVVKDTRVFIPNVFRPDDGLDQETRVFRIYGVDIDVVEKLVIYNRWGNLVYQANNFDPDTEYWDGNFLGKPAPVGVYVYYTVVRFDDGSTAEYKGDVTILR